jgi:hypothetical protein
MELLKITKQATQAFAMAGKSHSLIRTGADFYFLVQDTSVV